MQVTLNLFVFCLSNGKKGREGKEKRSETCKCQVERTLEGV